MYFKFIEFVKSDTATLYGIDNLPDKDSVLGNIASLWNTLEEIRGKLGAPIVINSAYRCKRLNELVGGVKRSLHMQGRSADIRTRPDKMQELRDILLTYEWSEFIDYSTFFHISL